MKLFKIYKKFISIPLTSVFGHGCRFSPTCSEYCLIAVRKYGLIKGGLLGFKRFVRCNPFSKPGFDPVI